MFDGSGVWANGFYIGNPINLELPLMRSIYISVFVFLFNVPECLATEVLLQCMDATGTEKEFLILKDSKNVKFLSKNGEVWGSYEETPEEFNLTFPRTPDRSAARVKMNRNNGMIEFETGRLPHLSIIWTANCSEKSR